jgi:hypothetical protein
MALSLSKDVFFTVSCPRLFKEVTDFHETWYKNHSTGRCQIFVSFSDLSSTPANISGHANLRGGSTANINERS